ncbi:hypothetical protein JCM6882_009328 [Rhodosporidiobolus microsporus]
MSTPLALRGSDDAEGEGQELLDLTRSSISPGPAERWLDELILPSSPGGGFSSRPEEMARRPRLDRLYSSTNGTSSSSTPQDCSTGIRSIAFGTFPAPDSFVAEWERAGREPDKLLLETGRKDGKTMLVANTLDYCQTSSGGTSLFLHLSRPPLFEVFPPPPRYGGLKELPRQVSYFDDAHRQVAGYSSRVLRVKLRTRPELDAFLKRASEVGLPRFISSKLGVEGSARYGATILATLQSWLLSLDVRIAFQLEKLVRNNLVDAVKVLALRPQVEELLKTGTTSRAERALSAFADRLGRLEAVDKEAPSLLEKGKENQSPTRSQGKKRRRDSFSSVLSLSSADDDDDDDDDDDEVQVGEAQSAFERSLSPVGPSTLDLAELRTILERIVADLDSRKSFLEEVDENNLVRQIIVTPSRILLAGPLVADSNTITRAYGNPHNFLSVSVRAEDGSRLRERDEHLILSRFKPFFQDGRDIAGRSFSFLAFSSSALKSATCFFVTPFRREEDDELVTPELIHREIGDFAGTETALIPAKYSARIAQAFSSSKPSLELNAGQIYLVDDETSPSGSCFSDGVGVMSLELAHEVVHALRLKSRPSCFQFRMGGAKGMLQVDPSLAGKVVGLRPSQIKFKSEMSTLEIAGVFGAGQAYLNRPLIKLLEDLGVKSERFLALQAEATKRIRKSRSTLRGAIKLA